MPSAGCVSERDLRAYLLGDLPERIGRSVTEHLASCLHCETLARRLDEQGDAVVESLRRALAPDRTLACSTGHTPNTAPPMAQADPIAARIGDYTVLEEVGRGGMAVVYKARQEHPARVVALKVLLAGRHSDAERRARFGAEGDTIARLQHPHIVQVHEAGEHDGLPFLVLEFCAGGSLAQRVGGRPQPPKFAAHLLEQLAGAVAHAHRAGVVHRDLKPANVLLTADGQPKVSDFGLARAERPDLTATGAVLGTPSYMAPEQADGRHDVGPVADVYALGAILYELLTGRPPFQGATTLDTLERVRSQEPVPPELLQAGTPRDLSTICLKCLQKEPSRRYPSALDLADDLRRFLDGKPTQARRASAAERLRRWARRNPSLAVLSATVAVLLSMLGVGSTVAIVQLNAALEDSRENLGAAAAARDEARARLGQSLLEQARANRRLRVVGHRLDSLRLLEQASRQLAEPALDADRAVGVTAELRNEMIACLALTDLEEVVRFREAYPAGTAYMAEDLCRQRYALADRAGVVRICRFEGRQEVMPRLPGLSPVGLLLFSPDGRFLLQQAADERPRFRVWDLSGSAARLVVEETTDGEQSAVAFRRDGTHLAIRAHDGSVRIIDTAAGGVQHQLRPGCVHNGALALHPQRHWLAVANGAMVRVVDAADGREIACLIHASPVDSIDWHLGGRLLASGCRDGQVHLWDALEGQRVWASPGHSNAVTGISFHPSAAVLTSCDKNSRMRLWDLLSGTELLAGTGNVGPWSAGNAPLVYQWHGSDLRLLRLAPQRVLRRLVFDAGGGRQALDGPVLDAQNRWLACGSRAGLVLFDLWDESGRHASLGPRHHPVAFDLNGGLLTASEAGLVRWPCAAAVPGTRRLGPPEALFAAAAVARSASCSTDQTVAALGCPRSGALLWRRDRPGELFRLGHQDVVGNTAVSPNGRWVVTGSSHDYFPDCGVKVWNGLNGRLAHDLHVDCGLHLKFSPDGHWLAATDLVRTYVWRVDSWEEGPRVGGQAIAFAPDGLMAVGDRAVVRLVDPSTAKEYARLDATDEPNPVPWCFSSDGSLLVAVGRDTHTLLLWDLRALRQELRERGMDWDRPIYEPASPPPTAGSVRVEFVPRCP